MNTTIDLALLQHVLDISRRMAETTSLVPLLDYAMHEAVKLVGAERGYLVLRQGDGTLQTVVRIGTDDDREDALSSSVLKQVFETGEAVVLRDALGDNKYRFARSVMHLQLRSVMCVPLISRGERIGAIYVDNRLVKGRFSEESLPPLTLFANQAAVAIENAILIEELENRVATRTRELEEANANVQHSWQEAVDANRLRTVFLGNVAHDLRSPLSIVIGALTMVREGMLGEINADQSEWLDKAAAGAETALKLTNDVFDLAKLEMGAMRLHKERTNLRALLTQVHEVTMALNWPPEVSFVLELADDLPTDICLDPDRLQQVLLNLVGNALKATQQGSITLYSRRLPDEQVVMIGVRDTGAGINPDYLGKLFERFYTFGTDKKMRKAGTGLGLAICRDLVEMHNGHIWAESEPDKGSDFKLVLPLNSTDCDS
jgi:signal transduction histidine kinase